MPLGRRRESPELPTWWNPSLYSFVDENFPQEGWVWEFMRRDRLREVLGDRPVDAMNPNPDLESIENGDYWNYYKPYNHLFWQGLGKSPYFFAPATAIPGIWPKGFAGQQYRIEDDELRHWRQINIDISRRDRVILRDTKKLLEILRKEHPQPQRNLPKYTNWFDQHILEVWDLEQFNVSWWRIAQLVGLTDPDQDTSDPDQDTSDPDKDTSDPDQDTSDPAQYKRLTAIQKARNSFTTAFNYINNGKWKELARYIES
jgi:hypothetical protein